MKRILLSILLGFSVIALAVWVVQGHAADATDALQIVRITPGGDGVSDLRQIVFEFNKSMVPLGDMARTAKDIPVEMTPKTDCEWRWLNETSLSCNLDEDKALSLATRYQITVNPGLVARDNSKMSAPFRHVFTTQLPSVGYAYLEKWKSPQRLQLHLWTNQPVTKESLEKALRFNHAKTQNVAALILAEEAKDGNGREWTVQPASDLPKGSSFALDLMPGLVSIHGIEKSTETRTLFSFDTFQDFAFIGVECTNNKDVTIRIDAGSTQANLLKLCNPQSSISLLFNAPVSGQEVFKHLAINPKVAAIEVSLLEEPSFDEVYQLSSNHTAADVYRVQLPALKPFQKYYIRSKESKTEPVLKDLFSRDIINDLGAAFATDHMKPNLNIPYEYAILELNSDSDVPVSLTNMKSFDFRFRGFDSSGEIKERTLHRPAPQNVDQILTVPLGIREQLGNRSGVLFGKFVTDPVLSKENPREFPLFAQVTPYQLHVKLGHFNTLVWVTDLQTGAVVSNAKVSIYKDSIKALGVNRPSLGKAVTDARGLAVLPGTSVIDSKLDLTYSYNLEGERLFVRVDKDNNLAVLPIVYDFEVSTWRASDGSVSDHLRKKEGHIVAWGTTAQGVYRLGDTIQYKIYVRNQNNESLTKADRNGYSLKVNDPTGKTVLEIAELKLSEFGAADGELIVSRQGSVGWYQFELVKKSDPTNPRYPMTVLVSDFTPSPFNVTQDLNGDVFYAGDVVKVSTHAKLHSGGAYGEAATRITASVESQQFYPTTLIAKGFEFSSAEDDERFKEVFQSNITLNKNGESESEFVLPPLKIYYGSLKVESAVSDERGKNIAIQSQAEYAGVSRFVGLRRKIWNSTTSKPVDMEYLVVDAKGNPKSGTRVSLEFEQQQTSIAKIKDVGATYSTHVTTSYKHHSRCEGVSTLVPLLCQVQPKVAGLYRLTAKIKDTNDKEQITQTTIWVGGKEPIVWNEKNGNFLEIEAEKPTAVVGETARFLVKNPYPNAKALITVERYGVIDSFVKTLNSSSAIIEIPVKESYLPGFYLSITIQSPRITKAKVTGQLDLGKPTFSMGYIDVPVVDRYKEIVVTSKLNQEVYRPREKVSLDIHAQPKIKTQKREPIEFAIAVVDESVLQLLSGGNENYDPYRGLYQFESLDLRNYSLLTRLIGRQKFEAKGANPGGGGGVDVAMRSVFKFVSYWNPSVRADANGNAKIEFEAPDNLTGWRVLVMAVTPSDRLGLGVAGFKVNRPTEIRPVMPNQVIEGDKFQASFSVMNRTNKNRDINVTIKATGNIDGQTRESYSQKLSLDPYQRATVAMPVKAAVLPFNRESSEGSIKFEVRAGDAMDTDGYVHTLSVQKNRSLETVAMYGSTTDKLTSQNILFPKNIYTDVGSVGVNLSASVIGSVDGAFRYLRDYPYTCWEQKLSKAVMANLYQQLKDYVSKDFSWQESAALPEETLKTATEFQAPNGGMCYFGASDEHADPYLSAYTALAFQWLRQSGKAVPSLVENKLHSYLINYLRRDASPDYFSEGMTATVRATILAALAPQGKISLTDLSRFEPQFDRMNLLGKSHFIQAAFQTSNGGELGAKQLKKLLSQSTQTGGKFMFSDANSEGFQRILSTPLRNNCAALSAMTLVAKKQGLDGVGDIPFKLVRTISETRKSRDYFENTQENMFCMKALADYAGVYESQNVNMNVAVKVDSESIGIAALKSYSDKPVMLSRPIKTNDPGKNATIMIERQGEGRLYYSTILSTASVDAGEKTLNAGMQLTREYSVLRNKKWILLPNPINIKRGELVRVDLFLSLPRPGNFVVVNDPISGGLEPVNQNLATSSSVDLGGDAYQPSAGSSWSQYPRLLEFNASHWSFYHKELHHDAARFYSDYLPKGTYHLYYTAQAVAEGTFTGKAPVAQEMYNPDVQGKDKAVSLIVSQ